MRACENSPSSSQATQSGGGTYDVEAQASWPPLCYAPDTTKEHFNLEWTRPFDKDGKVQ